MEPDLNPPEPATDYDASDDWKQERDMEEAEDRLRKMGYSIDELDRDNPYIKE